MSLPPAPDADALRRIAAERAAARARPHQAASEVRSLTLPLTGAERSATAAKGLSRKKKGGGSKRAPQPPVKPLAEPLMLVIPGMPVTKKNSPEIATNAKTGKPFIVPAPQYRRWARKAKPPLTLLARARGSIGEPVCLTATIYRERRVGDLVNYLQAACDLLEDAGVLENDKWVVAFDGSRLACDPANPRVELTLTPMEIADAA